LCVDGDCSAVLDKGSELAALSWLGGKAKRSDLGADGSVNSEAAHADRIRETLQTITQYTEANRIFVNMANPFMVPAVAAPVDANVPHPMMWFQWKVLVRIAFGYILFVQGQSNRRAICYAIGKRNKT
jgi:hypothetical protein